jgi:aconitase A
MGYFPVDEETIKYLRMIGAEEPRIQMIEQYLRA